MTLPDTLTTVIVRELGWSTTIYPDTLTTVTFQHRTACEVRYVPEPLPPVLPQMWRVKHDVEIGEMWRAGLPEVFRYSPLHRITLIEDVQRLWRALNPLMSDVDFCKLLGNKLALTNGSGFPGRANYILDEEMNKPDPYFEQPRLFGGAILREVRVQDGNLYIDAIDVRKPLPTAEEVLEHPGWSCVMVNINQDKDKIPFVSNFPQGGQGLAKIMPIMTARDEPRIPLDAVEKLPLGVFPSAYEIRKVV